MNQPLYRCLALAVVTGALIVVAGLSQAQDANTPPAEGAGNPAPAPPGADAIEKTSGVILKAGNPDDNGPRNVHTKPQWPRLTINTAVPWRDWVRDQVGRLPAGEDPATAGRNSIGTVGQPEAPENLVEVAVTSRTRVEVRDRAGEEEGAGDEAAGQGTSSGRPERKKRGSAASKKARTLRSSSLKPGLFVEVEYHSVEGENRALRITILRPTGPAAPPPVATPPRNQPPQNQPPQNQPPQENPPQENPSQGPTTE